MISFPTDFVANIETLKSAQIHHRLKAAGGKRRTAFTSIGPEFDSCQSHRHLLSQKDRGGEGRRWVGEPGRGYVIHTYPHTHTHTPSPPPQCQHYIADIIDNQPKMILKLPDC